MESDFRLVGDMGLLIRREVAAGFSDRQEIARHAVHAHAGDAPGDELRALAEELTASMLYQHHKAQRGWPLVTDCDRLDIAFAQLEQQGIVAGQGLVDADELGMRASRDPDADPGKALRGYVFYMRADTEGAIAGRGLYLDFGDWDDEDSEGYGDEGLLRIGHEIVAALRLQGLKVDWDGSPSPIRVNMDWKRRRSWLGQE